MAALMAGKRGKEFETCNHKQANIGMCQHLLDPGTLLFSKEKVSTRY